MGNSLTTRHEDLFPGVHFGNKDSSGNKPLYAVQQQQNEKDVCGESEVDPKSADDVVHS